MKPGDQAQPGWVCVRQVLFDQPDPLPCQGASVDEKEAVDVSTWTLVKPLTPFPTASPGETALKEQMGVLFAG